MQVIPQKEATENQMSMDDFERDEIKNAIETKKLWFGEPHLSFRQRLYQFIATVFVTLVANLSMKLKWQIVFCIYLGIVCPIGTYVFIKWIINLF